MRLLSLGNLLRPGAGAKGEDKRRGEDQILDQAGGEFPGVDVPYPHAFQLFHRVVPESLERLTRVERPIAQGVKLGVQEPVF